MSKSQSTAKQFIKRVNIPIASALRERFKQGYSLSDLKADLLAGFVVGMVAIPLGMALAIATGVPPQYGLYTVIFGGIVSILGGSRFSVTGPTAAFVVILAPIVNQHGLAGLLVASVIAGMIILSIGVSRLGQVITFIPYPVTTGFTSGIAVVIAVIQLKDFFGLHVEHMPDRFIEKISVLIKSAPTFTWTEFSVATLTLMFLVIWPKINKRIPSPLVVLSSMTVGVTLFNKHYPSLAVASIRDRFSTTVDGNIVHGIPSALPKFDWPWNFALNGSSFSLSYASMEPLMMAGIAIAILGAVETLLCAVVADGITQTDHDPDSELVALGIGNIVGPFFGAIPSTGAIVRTAINIRFGARTPVAAIFHSLFVLFIVYFCAEYVSYMPMASLAALLVYVAYGMFDAKHFFHCLNVSPRSDKAVLLTCFFLTVTFDMVIGVTVGVMLAALLFIHRMSTITFGSQWTGTHHKVQESLPEGVVVYEIAGPLFFGAAERAIEGSVLVNKDTRVLVFNLESVPTMDLTALVALESAILELLSRKVAVHIAGVTKQPLLLLQRSKVLKDNPQIRLVQTLHEALSFAKTDMLKTVI